MNRSVKLFVGMRIEADRHALPHRDFAGIDLVDFALRDHARQIGNLDDPLHPPARIADFLFVAAPVRDVDDRAVARREDRHLPDRVLRLRHDRRGSLLFAFEQRDLRFRRAFERHDALASRRHLLFRKRIIELDLLALFHRNEIGRRVEFQIALAQRALRFGKIQLLVLELEGEIGFLFLDFLSRLLGFGRFFFEAFLQLGGVEAEDRLAGFDVGAFGRHHRDLEVPDVVELRRTEAAGVERGERAGDIDAGDEIAASYARPFALPVGSELIARPSGGDEERDERQRNRDLSLHRLSPSFKPETTMHSRSLHSPIFAFFTFESAARGIMRASSTASRCTMTRAERPGRMRTGSRRSSLMATRNDRRSDCRLVVFSCATAEIESTRPLYVVDGYASRTTVAGMPTAILRSSTSANDAVTRSDAGSGKRMRPRPTKTASPSLSLRPSHGWS